MSLRLSETNCIPDGLSRKKASECVDGAAESKGGRSKTKRTIPLWLAVLGVCFGVHPGRKMGAGPAGVTAAMLVSEQSGTIPPTLFGMHVHIRPQREPWPAVPFGTVRLGDRLTSWPLINKSDGNYDWRQLDEKLAELKAHDIHDVLYTLGFTPSWASSRPNDNCARGLGKVLVGLSAMLGACDPPSDLNADGTGSDKHWKDFVTAVATHNKNSEDAPIKYWEIWNEPHNDFFWTGTFAQMVRMARDASTIIKSMDPGALILTPSVGLDPARSGKWMDGYLAAGGGEYADIIAFHGYVHSGRFGVYPSAADLIPRLNNFRKILAKYGQSSKPLWDTEGSWGNAKGMEFENEDLQAAFLAQFYLLHLSLGVTRLYWFAWNNGTVGTLWIPDSSTPPGPGRLTKAAIAYKGIYNWLVGSTLTKTCSQEGGLWTCGLTKADGQEAQIVWASHGEQNYSPSPLLTKMHDLDGNVTKAAGGIKVGSKPVLFESQ